MYTTQSIPVPAEFDDVFSHFYYAANRMNAPIHKTLLPSFQTILLFSLGTPVSCSVKGGHKIVIEKTMALGPIKQPLAYTLEPGSEMLVANFRPDAFYRFFGRQLLPLESAYMDSAGKNGFHEIWERLKPIPANAEKVNALLSFCVTYPEAREFSPKHMPQHSGLGNGRTATETEAGETPCYTRFKKAIDLLQPHTRNTTPIDWPAIVEQCGYCDHSRLIHDFHHFMDLSPTQYLKLQEEVHIARP